jgi:hypothetical protein
MQTTPELEGLFESAVQAVNLLPSVEKEKSYVVEESDLTLEDILAFASSSVKESCHVAKTFASASPKLQPRLQKIDEGEKSKLVLTKRLEIPEKTLIIDSPEDIISFAAPVSTPNGHMLSRVERKRYIGFVCSKLPLVEFLSCDTPKKCPVCSMIDPIKMGTFEGKELF